MIHPYLRKEVSLPANKNLSAHEAAKKPNIIPAYDSEDERIISDDYNDDTDFENKNFVEGDEKITMEVKMQMMMNQESN